MTVPYPITQERQLDPAQKRGILGLGRRERSTRDLARPKAHEVLVYRVHGKYVVDNARLGPSHEQVLDATHVSTVDLTSDTRVLVQLDIPSGEASPFTVQVSFACTVTDPVTVVCEGIQDAAVVLEGYLRGHHRIFELGLEYRIDQINEVRNSVNAQIRAFTLLNPPARTGMRIRLGSVEVLTPAELVEFEKMRRNQRQASTLAAERAYLDHSRHTEQEENDFELNDARQRHSHDLADTQQLHDLRSDQRQHQQNRLIEKETQRHHHALAEERLDFEEANLERLTQLVEADPKDALRMAYLAGQIDQKQLAEELRGYDERTYERTRQERELTRQDEFEARQLAREERLQKLELERDEREFAREQGRLQAKAEREDTQRERQWQRQLEQQRNENHREDVRWRREADFSVIKEMLSRGTFDSASLDLDSFERWINQNLTAARSGAITSAPAKELPDLAEPVEAVPDDDIRDEDVDDD
jgi:hypothetical protein